MHAMFCSCRHGDVCRLAAGSLRSDNGRHWHDELGAAAASLAQAAASAVTHFTVATVPQTQATQRWRGCAAARAVRMVHVLRVAQDLGAPITWPAAAAGAATYAAAAPPAARTGWSPCSAPAPAGLTVSLLLQTQVLMVQRRGHACSATHSGSSHIVPPGTRMFISTLNSPHSSPPLVTKGCVCCGMSLGMFVG